MERFLSVYIPVVIEHLKWQVWLDQDLDVMQLWDRKAIIDEST